MQAYQITETSTGRSGIVPANQLIVLDYPVNPRPRYGHGRPVHAKLAAILNENRAAYAEQLRAFNAFADPLKSIPLHADPASPSQPFWLNGWFSGPDAAALYCLLALRNPARLIEIGSGNSTKFARRAIADHALRTRIESIDPAPRAEIDAICDRVIRAPLEEMDLPLFDAVEPGDVVFFDGSHRTLMNSDCVAFFLDVLPRLRPGVLVHVHDVLLPLDYPPDWAGRFYSEQYLLAAYLLGGHAGFDVLLPVTFIGADPELYTITPLWEELKARGVPWGASFWMVTRPSTKPRSAP